MSLDISGKKVAIVGLGLLGASLGLALQGKGFHRLGWTRRKEVRGACLERGVIDETNDSLEEILAEADLTVLCLPIPQIIEYSIKYADSFKKGSIVTDIGSVKEAIVSVAEPELKKRGVFFVGGHPMAGTEKSGPDAAFKELYNGASVFVTVSEGASMDAVESVKSLWESINTKPVEIDVRTHDVLVAHTSHVQHIAALAITQAVLDCDEKMRPLRYAGCAGGFKDTSRIASSSPQMWREIIEHNQPAVLETVKEFEKRWRRIINIIENKDYDSLFNEFADGKRHRDAWIKERGFA
jgi:prephenate dehydrogenase